MTFLMNVVKVFLLGILEGFTDFIPIGRVGHFLLFDSFWTIYPSEFFIVFKTMIRLGSVIAVLFIFKDILMLDPTKDKIKTFRIWIKLILGTLPLLILGFLLLDFTKKYLVSNFIIGMSMIILGFNILRVENRNKRNEIDKIENISIKKSIQIGLYQCLALIPGCSLSTSRIIGALHSGCSRQVTGIYNLLLGIPILFIAILVRFVQYVAVYGFFSFVQCIYLIIGILISFIVTYIMVNLFLHYTKKHSFQLFGLYQMFLGLFIIVYFYVL